MNITELITVLILGLIFLTLLYIVVKRYLNLRTKVDEVIKDKVILKIAVPIKNEKKALAAEQLFQSLHGISKGLEKSKQHYSFEILGASHGIYFLAVCSQRYRNFVENQIYAQYPEAQISIVHDYAHFSKPMNVVTSELVLSKDPFLPIKTFVSFDVDPLASITGSISQLKGDSEVWIQIISRPIDNKWQEQGKKYTTSVKNKTDTAGNKVQLEPGMQETLSEIERKSNKIGFQFVIRIISKSSDKIEAERNLEDAEASFKQFQTGQFNSIIKKKPKKLNPFKKLQIKLSKLLFGKRLGDKLDTKARYLHRFLDEFEKNILNAEELASIYHLPHESVKTPNISWAKSKKLEIPLNLPLDNPKLPPEAKPRIFAVTDYRNIHIPFGIKSIDRQRHMYLLGKTGTGKTTLLKSLIVGDILDGKGLAVLDPHGDLVDELLNLIPESRMKDVVYLDPSDTEFPVALNMLDLNENETMDLLADGIVTVFKKFFGDSWGPRLQYLLTNTILTLLHCQNVSLLAVQRILVDRNYRKFLLKQVKDPFLLKFWNDEYEALSQNAKLIAEIVAPIQNKVGRFLGSPMVRNMVGQIKSSVNLREIMDTKKILLVNLSQGKIGEENSYLLGGMIITRLYTNAMQRAFLPKEQRTDFYLYVDEFQNFATDTFIKILSEARKYALNLIVTHQYIDQLSEEIQNAIFGNVGTLMNYVVGQKDALRLEKEFLPYLTAEDLVNLEKYRLTMKLTVDGSQTPPFTAIAMNPTFNQFNLKDMIKDSSRSLYAKPRETVEQKLNKWAGQEYDNKGNLLHN